MSKDSFKTRISKVEAAPLRRDKEVKYMTSEELFEAIGIRPETDLLGLIAEYLGIPREGVKPETISGLSDVDIAYLSALDNEHELKERGIPVVGKELINPGHGADPFVINIVDPRKEGGE